MHRQEYKILLDKFKILQANNKERKALGIHDYSLMNALLNKNREVELHSNFIYSMINPNSTHYCGAIFLKFFLESINEAGFINLDNARVYKEKGKIDLLIEDGEKVVIIENKLNAVDQPSQINRYILYTIDKYLNNQKELLSKNVHIVYLSEFKKVPTKESKSIEGFTLENGFLSWAKEEALKIEIKEKDKSKKVIELDLPKGTKLKFNRVQHTQHLLNWIDLSKEWLQVYKPNNVSRSLDYAFDEYRLILKRLDTKKQWRNLMSLDEYTCILKEDEQKDMYAFMCEANNELNNYLGKKLFKEISNLFSKEKIVPLSINAKKFGDFNEVSCIKWFNQKNNDYRDIGFEIKRDGENEMNYIFALGKINISYGTYKNSESYKWESKTNRENIQKNREKNLYDVINDVKKDRDNFI